MNCDRVHDLLSEAIDGTLSPSLTAQFDAHLGACPPCRLLLGDLKEALALLAEDPKIEPGPDFDKQVWRRIREERLDAGHGALRRLLRSLEPWRGGWMRLAPLAAAAAVLTWVATSGDLGDLLHAEAGRPVASIEADSDVFGGAEPAATVDLAEPSGPEFAPTEYPAGMPEAIEELLESGAASARELALNPDRYRRSNWRYPLRAVQDPLSVPVIPVAGMAPGPKPSRVSPRLSGPPVAQTGAPVLSF